ncbi:MAG: hypothetical protein WC838_07320 [Candidatus Margulisiibacteriota bacterium]|jgi:hypothetical protein
MYKTIEAIYDHGKVYPIDKNVHLGKSMVLITILGAVGKETGKLSSNDLKKFAKSIKLSEEPLKFQKRMRNEWK